MSQQVVVVGGGLSGLSAAHTVLQAGGRVVLLDRNMFLGGNSTKATSGINGGGSKTQEAMGIPDTKEIFEEDTIRSGTGVKKGPCPPGWPLAKVLTHQSAPAVEWLKEKFDLTLDTVSRLGGHSYPRTHRSKSGGKFPGMMITYALMVALDDIAKKDPKKARVVTKARVNKLIQDGEGRVIGVEYLKGGKTCKEMGPVVLATGGYGAGMLEKTSILAKVRPDLLNFATTNGNHCQGDGVSMVQSIGGSAINLDDVQVHPTGLVHPKDPDNPVKFLAAEALRGEGGILITREGKRFCNDLGTRDYCSGRMLDENKFPYRLVLNKKAQSGIAWHCKHYTGRGVMKHYKTGYDLAKDMKISPSALKQTFAQYNEAARTGVDKYEKKYFPATPFDINDEFHVAIVTPVVHYTMGGIEIDEAGQVISETKAVIPGLYAAGETAGGVHGRNRLGGSALLECVVFGRVAGASVAKYAASSRGPAASTASGVVTIHVPQASGPPIVITIGSGATPIGPAGDSALAEEPAEMGEPREEKKTLGEYSLEEVAKHNTENDCWVVVNGQVLDVTSFLNDHPGGKMAIMTFAGKDATEEFNMLHEKDVVEKYAPDSVVGVLKPGSKL